MTCQCRWSTTWPGRRSANNLTIRGNTREVVLDIEGPTPPIKDQRGNSRLGATAIAEVPQAIKALVARDGMESAKSAWLAEVRTALAYRPVGWESALAGRPGRLHPVALARPLQELLDSHPDSVLVADGGEIGV